MHGCAPGPHAYGIDASQVALARLRAEGGVGGATAGPEVPDVLLGQHHPSGKAEACRNAVGLAPPGCILPR